MAEHTPGPWTVEEQEGGYFGEYNYITGHITSPLHTYAGNDVSRRDSITDPSSMTRADAHLIAAAPDLLKALEQATTELAILKSVIHCGESWSPTLEESFAIMKAQALAAYSRLLTARSLRAFVTWISTSYVSSAMAASLTRRLD